MTIDVQERWKKRPSIQEPEFVAAKYWTSGSIAAGQITNFSEKVFDTHNAVTTGAGVWKFTAPFTGYYRILANVGLNAVWAFTSRGALYLYTNGVFTETMEMVGQGNPEGGIISPMGSTIVRLKKGDYIQVVADGGGNTWAYRPANTISIYLLSQK